MAHVTILLVPGLHLHAVCLHGNQEEVVQEPERPVRNCLYPGHDDHGVLARRNVVLYLIRVLTRDRPGRLRLVGSVQTEAPQEDAA